jgi:hypothetical protein
MSIATHIAVSENLEMRSKKNVREHGEVFTPLHIVEQMLALIPDTAWSDPEYIFFEPTCGNGNILVKMYDKRIDSGISVEDTLNTMIGLDISDVNVRDSRYRLYDRACTRLIKQGIVPGSEEWIRSSKRLVAITENNIFRVDDSLAYMKAGQLKLHRLVYNDPTGAGDVLTPLEVARITKDIDRRFLLKDSSVASFFRESLIHACIENRQPGAAPATLPESGKQPKGKKRVHQLDLPGFDE